MVECGVLNVETKAMPLTVYGSMLYHPLEVVLVSIVAVVCLGGQVLHLGSRFRDMRLGGLIGLAPSTILNIPLDGTDANYRGLRTYLLPLVLFCAVHLLVAHLVRSLNSRQTVKALVDITIGLVGCVLIHTARGAMALLLVVLLGLVVDKVAHIPIPCLHGRVTGAQAIWTYLVIMLLSINSRWCPITWIVGWVPSTRAPTIGWAVGFRFWMLRLVSFFMDRHWSSELPQTQEDVLTYKARVKTPLQPEDYDYLSLCHYLLYPPLQLAGPIVTFNAFKSQTMTHQTGYNEMRLLKYATYLGVVVLGLDLYTHTMYTTALIEQPGNYAFWSLVAPGYIPIFVTLHLFFIWAKYAIMWGSMRLWALLDGVETIENQMRFYLNNHTYQMFWRGWHASFNAWLIRYIYIPLGGRNRKIPLFFLIFTFVGLWHDVSWTYLQWAWIVFCLVSLEAVTIQAARKVPCVADNLNRETHFFKYLLCIPGSLSMAWAAGSNFVTFGIGKSDWRSYEIPNWQTSDYLLLATFCAGWSAVCLLSFHYQRALEGEGNAATLRCHV
ncbi:MAG: hypothetical protein KVP17_002115 [Porospora cf. gigantea B]|uniref:uncharacterized protein n=1 Tax=Porospora cf. gigantea B TaxID=2853592 RepID=UPI0035717A4A|nr:MAG: hypothetical protein KVP17_002115 [Porospora cf. gigantea B]